MTYELVDGEIAAQRVGEPNITAVILKNISDVFAKLMMSGVRK